MPASAWGQGTGGYRDVERVARGRLDRGQRLRQVALALDCAHDHRRPLDHPHARGGLLGGLLGPPPSTGCPASPHGPAAGAPPDATAAAPAITPAPGLRSARAASDTDC